MMSSTSSNSDSVKVISFEFSMTLSLVVEPGIGIIVGNPLRPLYDRTLVHKISICHVCVWTYGTSFGEPAFGIRTLKGDLGKVLTMQELSGLEYNLSLSLLSVFRSPSLHSSPDCQLRTWVNDVGYLRDPYLHSW